MNQSDGSRTSAWPPTARCLQALAVALTLLTAGPATAEQHSVTLTPPKPVPPVSFVDGEGKTLGLDAFRGKVVVLDFWATWCLPCRAEFPALDRLQGRLGGQGLAVVAVSLDRKGMPAVEKFYDDLHVVHLGRYLDDTRDIAQALGIRGLPTTLVLDRQGREVARLEGPATWDGPEIGAVLEGLLKP